MTPQEAMARTADGTPPGPPPMDTPEALFALLDQDHHKVRGWELTPDARVMIHHLERAFCACRPATAPAK